MHFHESQFDLEVKNLMKRVLEAKDDFMECYCNLGSQDVSGLVSNPRFLELGTIFKSPSST